jgi:predicted acyl esterase
MRFPKPPPSLLALAAFTIFFAAGCGDSKSGYDPGPQPTSTPTPEPTSSPQPTPPGMEPASFEVHGSVNQVWLIDAEPGQTLQLENASGEEIRSGEADDFGSIIFREILAGDGYRVTSPEGAPAGVASPAFTVRNPDQHPGDDFYQNIQLREGYQYLETRDGTLLAVNVLLPGPIEDGPYATVVEYSGYSAADPNNPQPSMLIAGVLGYASVGVNMRGTGCSGGAFEFFEDLQNTDGYDVIEAVAAQIWSARTGMVGLSYPAIASLFTAQTQPPSLAGIFPNSVISDTGKGTLRPGGILNSGFAVSWAGGRDADSKRGGQRWSRERLEAGDQTCIDNMKLRDQTIDIFGVIDDNAFYRPEVADPLAPDTFVDKITVPVCLAGTTNDEQTGGYWLNMIAKFTGTEDKKFTITNGGHTDSIGPESFARWLECLELFVAERTPQRGVGVLLISDFVAGGIFKVDSLEIPESRFDPDMPYEEALAFWRETPDVLVLMENGGYPEYPGYPYSTFQIELDTWPTPHENLTLYLESADPSGDAVPTLEGGMTPENVPTSLDLPETGPSAPASEQFLYDTSFSKVQTLDGADGGPWDALPGWNWQEATPGTNLKFTTAPLEEPLLLAGSAAANLYVHASVADVDLQVTLSEVRPDGCEVYIQNGWLRASRRKLDPEQSTTTRPVSTHLEADAADLPGDEFTLLPLEIFPFSYYLRAGSSIRMEISAPGRTRPEWKWDALEYDEEVVVKIAVDGTSHLTLPEVTSVTSMTMPPETLPACPGLRGMPTRQAQ